MQVQHMMICQREVLSSDRGTDNPVQDRRNSHGGSNGIPRN